MKSTICFFVFGFLIANIDPLYSQFHFDVKYAARDISDQRKLFKNANVEIAIISDNSDFNEKITFDRDGKILEKMSYLSGDEDTVDGRSIYEYNIEGNLISIKFESGDAMRPDEFIYDINGNVVRYISEVCDEKFKYNDDNELVSSEILSQAIEKSAIELVKYENGKILEIKTKCWDEGTNAPYVYSRTKFIYDMNQRMTGILQIDGNCNTGIENISAETTVEYNERNLPFKYVTRNSAGDRIDVIIKYKHF
ncbi:MAG: hypothetical protein IPG02_17305 [Ignavibacteria bacterium]|nr:hypothetical protein [Ignavibacteria bacterium]